MIPSMKSLHEICQFCMFSESHFAPIPTFGGEIGQVYLSLDFYLMHIITEKCTRLFLKYSKRTPLQYSRPMK